MAEVTMSAPGLRTPRQVMQVWVALITTATGLLIAIPTLVAYNIFQTKSNGIVTDLERETLRVLRGLRRANEALGVAAD